MVDEKDDVDIEAFISDQAEVRWPGITVMYARYNKLKGEDPKLASAFAFQHPEVKEYMDWAKDIRKNYNEKLKLANPEQETGADWSMWSRVLEDNVQRLLVDYFNGGDMSEKLRSNLYRTWQLSGRPMGSFDAWVSAMRSSYSGRQG
jgi:hypothetical protein